jgi:hypothetical protein
MGLTRVGLTFADPITGAHSDCAASTKRDDEGSAEDVNSMRKRAEECEHVALTSTTARDAHAVKRDAATAKVGLYKLLHAVDP